MNKKLFSKQCPEFIAYYKKRLIQWSVFEMHVQSTRRILFSREGQKLDYICDTKIINLCEDKYHFLVLFTASLTEKKQNIMPSSRCEAEISRICSKYNSTRIIKDCDIEHICQTQVAFSNDLLWQELEQLNPSLVVAQIYSSGSSGIPSENSKTWGQLITTAKQVQSELKIDKYNKLGLVATVPPQHMFGFEFAIILPLISGVIVHHKNPFYAMDIQLALKDLDFCKILVTTPFHLKVCNTISNDWPKIEFALSATAALPKSIAIKSEKTFCASVKEIYGSSESGALATRRLTKNPNWELFSDYSLEERKGEYFLKAEGQLIKLPDTLDIFSSHSFALVGRHSDIVKIGGKRCSIAQITLAIRNLVGVEDVVVFKPNDAEDGNTRLAALVIVIDTTIDHLRQQLKKIIDPIFIPRPFIIVNHLPYNSTGKLPRSDLLSLLEKSSTITSNKLEHSFMVPKDHPSLEGHFPNNPIVPGVVSLDNIIQGLISYFPNYRVGKISHVKFLLPITSQKTYTVHYSKQKANFYRFTCFNHSNKVIAGELELLLRVNK